MSKLQFLASALAAAGLLAAVAPASAQAQAQARPQAQAGTAAVPSIKGPTLAASANRALAKDDVPSVRNEPVDVKAEADADLARRDVQPRMKATRENLKGDDAKHALAQQQKPSTYDRDIQMGDKDHTEQVTDVKVFVKK